MVSERPERDFKVNVGILITIILAMIASTGGLSAKISAESKDNLEKHAEITENCIEGCQKVRKEAKDDCSELKKEIAERLNKIEQKQDESSKEQTVASNKITKILTILEQRDNRHE